MKNKSERIKRDNLIIDVTINKTKIGDFVATAKFPGNLGLSVSRHPDPIQSKVNFILTKPQGLILEFSASFSKILTVIF